MTTITTELIRLYAAQYGCRTVAQSLADRLNQGWTLPTINGVIRSTLAMFQPDVRSALTALTEDRLIRWTSHDLRNREVALHVIAEAEALRSVSQFWGLPDSDLAIILVCDILAMKQARFFAGHPTLQQAWKLKRRRFGKRLDSFDHWSAA